MKRAIYALAALLAVLCVGTFVHSAVAPALSFSAASAANLSRPCSHAGVTGVTGASTGSSAQANGTGFKEGAAVMVTCFNNAWGAQGATGLTAVATGVGIPITKNVPYWFVTELAGTYFAFIKQSGETDSTCSLIECR